MGGGDSSQPARESLWNLVPWVRYTFYGEGKLAAYFVSSDLNTIIISFFLYKLRISGTSQ
jgi:hypothetical protein